MKRITAAALAALLAGPALAQSPAKPDVMTITGADGKAHACKVVRTYAHPSGGTAFEVRDTVTGETMTVIENASLDAVKVTTEKPSTTTESLKPVEGKPIEVKIDDPILEPKQYANPKVQAEYGSTPAAPPPSPSPSTSQYTKPPVPATRRWFNWMRNDPKPAPMPVQQTGLKLPAGETMALYDQDPVIRLIGSMADDLLPSMREVSAETLARTAKDRPEVVQAIIRTAKNDPAPTVRTCCCRCLVEMKVRSPECVEVLKGLQEEDRDQGVRTAAAAALSVLEPQ
jgi:hypothetical protein